MARVHDEVMQREEYDTAQIRDEHTRVYSSELDAGSIEALLVTARKMAKVRTIWPGRLWLFPFTVSASLRRSLLRLFAFLFNDQRHVNFALVEAIRELLQITKELHGLIAVLQSEVRQLENQLASLKESDAGE